MDSFEYGLDKVLVLEAETDTDKLSVSVSSHLTDIR